MKNGASKKGGWTDEEGRGIQTDEVGNIYWTGYYQGLINLAYGQRPHSFIEKLDPNGNSIFGLTN